MRRKQGQLSKTPPRVDARDRGRSRKRKETREQKDEKEKENGEQVRGFVLTSIAGYSVLAVSAMVEGFEDGWAKE